MWKKRESKIIAVLASVVCGLALFAPGCNNEMAGTLEPVKTGQRSDNIDENTHKLQCELDNTCVRIPAAGSDRGEPRAEEKGPSRSDNEVAAVGANKTGPKGDLTVDHSNTDCSNDGTATSQNEACDPYPPWIFIKRP